MKFKNLLFTLPVLLFSISSFAQNSNIAKDINLNANKTSSKYIMATYSTNELFGLELGRLSYDGVGTYFNLSMNENVQELTFSWIESIGSLTPEELEQLNKASIAASFGLTYKITYPLWIYGGVGIVYSEYYEYEQEKITYDIENVENYHVYPELGVKVKLGRIGVLKAGGSYINGEVIFNAGLGFQTKSW